MELHWSGEERSDTVSVGDAKISAGIEQTDDGYMVSIRVTLETESVSATWEQWVPDSCPTLEEAKEQAAHAADMMVARVFEMAGRSLQWL